MRFHSLEDGYLDRLTNNVHHKEKQMSTIHLHQTTTLTPEQYIAGLTDFGPDRSKLFGKIAPTSTSRCISGAHAGRRHRRL